MYVAAFLNKDFRIKLSFAINSLFLYQLLSNIASCRLLAHADFQKSAQTEDLVELIIA